MDAECTHDGSLKHLAKFSQWGWETFERRFLTPDRLAELQVRDTRWPLTLLPPTPNTPNMRTHAPSGPRAGETHHNMPALDAGHLQGLQRALLRSGYRRLKAGGTLVYSTCSFSERQNEDVVRWLLQQEPSAEVRPVEVVVVAAAAGSDSAAGLPAPLAPLVPLPGAAGTLKHTLRFGPGCGTSGLFVAKIQKRGALAL